MKIVIDIPEKTYKYYNTLSAKGEVLGFAERAIMLGTPLPEHHGRLIDEQQIIDRFKPIEKFKHWYVGTDGLFNVLSDAPTIIEGSDSE